MKQYYYFYKTNMINNHYYYGIHSTNNLMMVIWGWKTIHVAYEKYGIENFSKEILCFLTVGKNYVIMRD